MEMEAGVGCQTRTSLYVVRISATSYSQLAAQITLLGGWRAFESTARLHQPFPLKLPSAASQVCPGQSAMMEALV